MALRNASVILCRPRPDAGCAAWSLVLALALWALAVQRHPTPWRGRRALLAVLLYAGSVALATVREEEDCPAVRTLGLPALVVAAAMVVAHAAAGLLLERYVKRRA